MPLKLTLLSVSDYKRVTEADIHLDPTAAGVVALMGPNESGKTSTLDAFEALIAGRAAPKRRKPVRDGADRAVIIGEFTDPDGTVLRVTRTYVEGGATSIVVHQDGIRVAKADAILRRLYSHIALDPLAFANSGSKDQTDTLIRLIGFDPAEHDRRIADAYATRTDVNRDLKRYETELAAYPPEDAELAASEPVSVATLAQEVDEVYERNRLRDENAEDIQRGRTRIAQLEEDLAVEREELASAEAYASTAGPNEDPGEIREQIRTAEATNDAIRLQRNRARQEAEVATLRDRVRNLEGIMSEAEAAKAAAFDEAEWPVPGLSIVDGEVYLDGTPFAETSAGRKLRTSTAIAMRLNPDLRAIVIRDGSLLDDGNRQMIHDIAVEAGYTVLMELLNDDAETGVVFSEGAIVDRKGAVS